MVDCIDNCLEAAQACELCATACTREDDEEMARCIELCRDVADLTTSHLSISLTNSSPNSHGYRRRWVDE